ncbi:MAG: Ldh family oxidoreductase [Alteraurantiacibacter sp.]
MTNGQQPLEGRALARGVARMFAAAGIPASAAAVAAEDLVAADLEGVPSHGVMLVPMYLQRIRQGSVSCEEAGEVVSDRQGAIVIDGHNVLGQLTARQAVDLAASRAADLGIAAVAVRNAFHFGTAGRYARMLADRGCIGIVMCNTRPLMPPPGGAQPVTGNNPIAIAAPSAGPFASEVDMALSAAAMGKIRNAAAAGQSIPPGWATDSEGAPTTDPNAAIAGMLLPAAGPKGFGLACMIDLLCGGLSDGGIGSEVRPLFGMLDQPYGSANLFIALNVGHFTRSETFAGRAAAAAEAVSSARRAPGFDRIFAPGEMAHCARESAGGWCHLAAPTLAALRQEAALLGLDPADLFTPRSSAGFDPARPEGI